MQGDEFGRIEEHRLLWREPTTIAQLGELTAQWLEGNVTYQPGYPDSALGSETNDLIKMLSAVNRAGLFTTLSSPSSP